MPLPWLLIFLLIFMCFYTVSLYISTFSFSSFTLNSGVKATLIFFPW